ncbi:MULTISPECIES: ribonuclease HII [unclassified Candidatus Frackibacter]|uniref:ribonuclease HII n=1 Tax=unclassified Candidatus Frackibacter TaxID=2648818 RepID=UPI0008857E6B|nr:MULTISPECIES: ribonuclease HII [unclassified Candidatus Frackibacter]SDC00755.1 RNase HII [Candidatus Frackibacter sp. WG11]SEM32150.1 RNase HII [Candidatus Frackibacter sp. WG12]SFL37051.1 RNase HII [Candidatus Frackibacter sp. WG13]
MNLEDLSIKEIKAELKKKELNRITDDLIEQLEADGRKGVKTLSKRYRNKKLRAKQEKEKFQRMQKFEKKLFAKGYELIGGVDEAGRGPLAGPVVASVVILPQDIFIPGLDDSKKLSESKREELFDIIQDEAIDIGVGIVDSTRIDEINIRNATFQAMQEAIISLETKVDYLLVDGEEIPGLSTEQRKLIDGDARSISIAAASIIAKVTRDRMLVEYDKEYPEYGFTQHKGYGTVEHIAALNEHGPCEVHRYSFSKVKESALGEDFYLFKEGLEEANSIVELEVVASTIKDCEELLIDVELEELRNIFLRQKKELR